jgi:1,4-dihydroxy-2-naphthoyl-CoA hydrolase
MTRDEMLTLIASRDPHTAHAALGIKTTKIDVDECVVEVEVTEKLFQHGGVVHGGIYVLLMESTASMLTALSVDLTKFRVAGQEVSASHLRPVSTGTLVGRSRVLNAGKTAWVCASEVHGDGKLVSTGRCTIAIRPF